MKTFESYLIMIGIRSTEYGYTDEVLFNNIQFFKDCFEQGLSAYKALLYLSDNIKPKAK
jgi:hypothetical protein